MASARADGSAVAYLVDVALQFLAPDGAASVSGAVIVPIVTARRVSMLGYLLVKGSAPAAPAPPTPSTARSSRPDPTHPRETVMPTTASTTTMRAIVQDGYGSADVLRTEIAHARRSRTTRCSSRCTPPGSTAAPGT